MSGDGNNGIGAVLGTTTAVGGTAILAQTGNASWIIATAAGAAIIAIAIVVSTRLARRK